VVAAETRQLTSHDELNRLMGDRGISVRALGAAIGLGKSTVDRLRSGGQRLTSAESAKAIETELGVEPGSLFVVPDVPRAPRVCRLCGADRTVAA
jgi:transcriptional regulator with XRE-family HTH domain